MVAKRNALILHSTVTPWSTLVMDVALARLIGFDGMELSADKVEHYLAAGYSPAELAALLDGLAVPAMGFVIDVERHGADRPALLREVERICRLASLSRATAIQVISGPVDVRAVQAFGRGERTGHYFGVLGASPDEKIRVTADGLALVADVAAEHGLIVYFEGLGWTPINSLDRQLQAVRSANRDNLRLVVDFWHCYVSGDRPEQIARLPKELICGVHVCDSLKFETGIPDESILRDVSTGSGVLDLREWVDAVKATGYDDWWSCELFCKRDHQGHSPSVAGRLHETMRDLIH